MTAAMQAANALAEHRLRAVAELIAAGCPEDCITWYESPDCGNFGLAVCGRVAWECSYEWRAWPGEEPSLTVESWWYGGSEFTATSGRHWVPTPEFVAQWRRQRRRPCDGPALVAA